MKKIKRNLLAPKKPAKIIPGSKCMLCGNPLMLRHVCPKYIAGSELNGGQRMNQEFSKEEIENSEKEFQDFLDKRKTNIEKNIGVDSPQDFEREF